MLKVGRLFVKSLEIRLARTQITRNSYFLKLSTLYLTDNQRDILQNTHEDKGTETDWDKVREFLRNTNRNINDVNIHGLILNFYASTGNIQSAKSYLKNLESQSDRSHLLVKSLLFRAFYAAVIQNGYKITQDDQELMTKIYRQIKAKYEVLDSGTCENLILGLSLTNQLKNCLQLLEDCKLTGRPSRNVYSAMITASFRNSDATQARKFVEEIIESRQNLTMASYSQWLGWCINHAEPRKEFENLFECLEKNELLLSRKIAEELQASVTNKLGVARETHISTNGNCSTCRKVLSRNSLSDTEFNMLKDEFLNRVLIRSDIYLKTNPAELQRFKSFLETNGPYDCVVDGLNVAYSAGVKNSNSRKFATLLAHVVTYLSRTNRRILVLGRKHMNSWPADQMEKITSRADTFYTENLSQDDPYLLYAALYSGANTHFCSRDMMRGHAFLLGEHLRMIFHKWRQHHQYQLIYAVDSSKVVVKVSSFILRVAQKFN